MGRILKRRMIADQVAAFRSELIIWNYPIRDSTKLFDSIENCSLQIPLIFRTSYDQWNVSILISCKVLTVFVFRLFPGTLFYYFYLPETKGKTLQEIEDYFSGRTTTLKTKKPVAPSNFNININTAANEQTVRVEKEKLLLA